MGEIEKLEGMLSPYRVLDLTDEKGLLCGKLLGDLGADVIKIERPGGDSARSLGPFYHDEVDPEKSLFWFAFNTSKRGITLDIETADGQEIFKRLVKSADFVIESFSPGYIEELGLGYSTLERINPGVILVSITPFGQTGPYKDYKAPDIVAWAMGGQMYPFGDADRPPVRISHPCQAYLHTGAEAAIGAMMALFYREMTGEGQQVDVSVHATVAKLAYGASMVWDSMKMVFQRGGQLIPTINIIRMWPCKDGYVMWFYFIGSNAERWNQPFLRWMESEGMGDDFLKEFDWNIDIFDSTTITQEKIDRIAEPTRKFFMSHTKAELLEGSVKHNVLLFPVSTTADILDSAQLAARGFWAELEHPELDTTITYPGPFAHASEAPPRVSRRAPLIGEHNQEIYRELGISMDKPLTLSQDEGSPVQISKKNPKKNLDERPLDGVKVADFAWWAAAPLATKTLAQYGAEVLRIEGRSRPDLHRIHPPFKDGIPGENRGGGFNWANTGKLSIALNLAHPKGLELAKRFVAWADIVVESFAGGVMERMGLGYEELKKIKPDIIMLSSCIQGQTGPHAAHPGFGPHLTALSGFAHIAGWPDREPVELGNYTDFIAPYFNALAPLAALDYRRRTGKGQYLDLSQYENAIHFLAPLILDHTANGRVANRMGNCSPDAAPHGAYRCRGEDRWCAIAIFTDEEWRSFCEVIGDPAWTEEPKFATLQARKENEEELDRLVEEWTIDYSPEEVMTMMQTAGVGAGLLATGEDLVEHDPQLRHRHFFHELDHPEVGKYYPIGSACVLSKSPGKLQRAPLLGEHNEYAFKEILGMSDGEIAELVIEGVIE